MLLNWFAPTRSLPISGRSSLSEFEYQQRITELSAYSIAVDNFWNPRKSLLPSNLTHIKTTVQNTTRHPMHLQIDPAPEKDITYHVQAI